MSQSVDFYGNAGGGGYLTGGSPFGSTSGSPGGLGRRGTLSQSIRPITVKQFYQATQAHPDADWMLESTVLGHVTLVGHIVSVQKQATNCVYKLSDGTGALEVRHWSDSINQDDGDDEGEVKPNTHAKVTGTIKTFGSKKYINATRIRTTTDFHEPFYHQLHTMYVQVQFERGPPGSNAQTAGPSGGQSLSAYSAGQVHQSTTNDQYGHLEPVSQSIVRFMLNQPQRPEGVHVSAIAKAVGGSAESIERALEQLMDDGIIFSTINETHFQVSQ